MEMQCQWIAQKLSPLVYIESDVGLNFSGVNVWIVWIVWIIWIFWFPALDGEALDQNEAGRTVPTQPAQQIVNFKLVP